MPEAHLVGMPRRCEGTRSEHLLKALSEVEAALARDPLSVAHLQERSDVQWALWDHFDSAFMYLQLQARRWLLLPRVEPRLQAPRR